MYFKILSGKLYLYGTFVCFDFFFWGVKFLKCKIKKNVKHNIVSQYHEDYSEQPAVLEKINISVRELLSILI